MTEGNDSSFPAETTPLLVQSTSSSSKSKPYSNLPALHIKFSRDNGSLNDSNGEPEENTSISATSTLQDPAQTAAPVPTQSSSFLNRSRNPLQHISLTLENSGSVARDHLASERTFLAYVRTSLAMASSGVALVQLFTVASANLRHYPEHRLHTYIRPLGAMTIALGLIVLVIGVVRYFSIQTALTKGKFPVARAIVGFVGTALVGLVIVTFGILLAGKLEPPINRH